MSEELFNGYVIFFNNKTGYGFIDWSKNGVKQTDLFIHYSDINCEGFKTIKKGQYISFTIGKNLKGMPKACNVTVLS